MPLNFSELQFLFCTCKENNACLSYLLVIKWEHWKCHANTALCLPTRSFAWNFRFMCLDFLMTKLLSLAKWLVINWPISICTYHLLFDYLYSYCTKIIHLRTNFSETLLNKKPLILQTQFLKALPQNSSIKRSHEQVIHVIDTSGIWFSPRDLGTLHPNLWVNIKLRQWCWRHGGERASRSLLAPIISLFFIIQQMTIMYKAISQDRKSKDDQGTSNLVGKYIQNSTIHYDSLQTSINMVLNLGLCHIALFFSYMYLFEETPPSPPKSYPNATNLWMWPYLEI